MSVDPRVVENRRWAEEHLTRLQKDHPSCWVAVVEQQVAATGNSLQAVRAAVAEEADHAYFFKTTKGSGKLW